MKSGVLQPTAETADAINWLANNDLKALAYIGLMEHGESTTTELGNALAEHAHPEAYHPVRAYPITYAKAQFAETTTGVGSNGRPATFYTAARTLGALAPIGALLEWSEDYNYPLVTALSTTASKGDSCAPLNTLQILDGLHKGLSITAMDLPGYRPTERGWATAHNTRLNKLLDLGFVAMHDEEVKVRILNPDYKGSLPFKGLKEGRQGFYRTVTMAKELDPGKTWSLVELESLAQRLHLIDDNSIDDFHDALKRAVSINAPRYAPGVVEKVLLKPRQYTVAEATADMTQNLVARISQIERSQRYAAAARDYARDTYRSPIIARRIAQRALDHSAYRKMA